MNLNFRLLNHRDLEASQRLKRIMVGTRCTINNCSVNLPPKEKVWWKNFLESFFTLKKLISDFAILQLLCLPLLSLFQAIPSYLTRGVGRIETKLQVIFGETETQPVYCCCSHPTLISSDLLTLVLSQPSSNNTNSIEIGFCCFQTFTLMLSKPTAATILWVWNKAKVLHFRDRRKKNIIRLS